MDYNALADLLYPDITETPQDMENRFPPRNLPENAAVTRFAPSPTGYVHFGCLFPTRVSERLARQSGGIFFLRIEDTDTKREVKGAEQNLISTLKNYSIIFDEGPNADGTESGNYGPYHQTQRKNIYHVYAKDLVRRGKAYPCFCSDTDLTAIRDAQKKEKLDFGYYGKWAVWRDAPIEKIKEKLDEGADFTLRFRSEGSSENKFKFTDLIKGTVNVTENFMDHVIVKSNGIPPYGFAHPIDDHLMRVTHVVRGEEWLPSLPFHLQLFRALGFTIPKYMHISQLMKQEGSSKKKLSKRDNGVDMRHYDKFGYPPVCLTEYIMTLLNSNYEEWRRANPDASFEKFNFSVKKMSTSGCLLDLDKLNDVSKNMISKMTTDDVYEYITKWAKDYDNEFHSALTAAPAYAKAILSIGRAIPKPRKDLATWSDAPAYMSFFYDEYFKIEDTVPEGFEKNDIKNALEMFIESYDASDDNSTWFSKIKDLSEKIGFAPDMKLYKADPDAYKGNVGDVSGFIRIAVTGRQNSPDLYDVLKILGRQRAEKRIDDMINSLN